MRISSVLVVDDEPDIRALCKLSLERVGGWLTFLAASGQEALELAEARQPDVILLDVMMPGMDGPTTLHALKNRGSTAGIHVVFLSAKIQKHEMQGYKDLGATGVITKPFNPMTLPRELQRTIDAELAL